MARGPGHRPLILLRWILLGLLLVAAAFVLKVYLSRDTEPSAPRVVADDPGSPVESDEVVLAAEGFEYEVIDEGVTLFFIRADRMVSDKEDRFVLEGVELRTEEEDGGQYSIMSERAIYDLESRDARLEGSVVMTGPDGVELRGEEFDLQRSGRILESVAEPVAFRLPGGHAGTSLGVRINLNRNSLLLRGDVAIDSPPGAEPPMRLTARRMLYREEEALLRTEGGAVLTRGEDRLSARRLSVSFEPRDRGVGDVRFVQGTWDVAGRLALGDDVTAAQTLEFAADRMGVAFGAGGDEVESVALESRDRVSSLRLDDGAGRQQTLRARSIFGRFADGALSSLETFTPAVLEESLALPQAPPLRRLCGNTLRAGFDTAGALGELVLEGQVDYRDGGRAASGERLEGDPDDELRLTGEPARLLGDAQDLEAPRIVYSRGGGSLLAAGGVRASGMDRSGVELASGDESLPVLVTAEQARWEEEPPEVAFEGDVRAWQGDSFLLADELRVLEEGERLEGEGSVKTVMRPQPGDGAERRTIEVNAEEMVYIRRERRLSYSREVRAHEAGRTLQCDDLDLQLDDRRRVESLFCEGNVVVDDPVNGRTVRGNEAVYTVADRLVLFTGAPVVMEQRDGTAIEGRRLRYDVESGAVRILSEPRTSGPEAELAEPEEPDDG